MSFLLDDDEHATLQVALAFIDAADDEGATRSIPSSNTSSNTSSNSESPAAAASDRFILPATGTSYHEQLTHITVPGGLRRSESPIASSTAQRGRDAHYEAVKRSRAKKKAEALRLRDQVAVLEENLMRLQRGERSSWWLMNGSSDVTRVLPAKPMWLEIATLRAQECHKSQALNAELREAVGKQAGLVKALEAMLSKKSNQFGLHLLREEQKAYLFNDSVLQPQEPHVVADLRRRVEHLYLDLEATFAHDFWTEMINSVVCTSQLKLDPVAGPISELRMSAPLRGSVEEAGELLWRCIMVNEMVVQTPQYYMKRTHLTHSSLLKNYAIQLDGSAGSVELQGISYVQRFSGASHDAYIWSSAILSSQDSEVFREKGYVVASSVPASAADSTASAKRSLLRGFYQVSCDAHDNETSSQVRRQREFVLKTLGNRIRNFQQFMQSLLLDEFAGGTMGRSPQFLSSAATCQNW
ncbi:hypothetical protein Gpo141_00003714 [Globisporangium polare]